MLHRIVFQKRARQQFQSICDYLADEFGERVTDKFIFEVEQCVATLMKFPESGHLEPIESKYVYRSKIVGMYNTLVIAAFADMRMHPDNVKKVVLG